MNNDTVTNGNNGTRWTCPHKDKCGQVCNGIPKHGCLLAKDFVVAEEYWDDYFKNIISSLPVSSQYD